MTTRELEVVHDGTEWVVRYAESGGVARRSDDIASVVEFGKKLAWAHKPSRLTVRRQDASVDANYEYARDSLAPVMILPTDELKQRKAGER